MKKLFTILFFLLILFNVNAQSIKDFADSIRKNYRVPELAYAVLSADSIYEIQVLGLQRVNADFHAKPTDRFHIGSNTKAITSFLAALLVQQEKIKWDTKFLDLFPALKKKSNQAYWSITLRDLLTFRGKLPSYTYTFDKPTKKQITGDNARQRLQLAKYFLSQYPMEEQNGLTASNADYILGGLMLEKASGEPYKKLVTDFGKAHEIDFGFDYPNLTDSLQPWGHDSELNPVAPFDNYKLNWLLSAGNINVSMPDYVKFIQLQLRGLKRHSTILPQEIFDKLLYGLPVFSFGWFNKVDTETNHHIAFNEGNAGAFTTKVEIIKEADRAYIIFTNSAAPATKEGIDLLLNRLKNEYGK